MTIMNRFQNQDTYLATVCTRHCPPKRRPPKPQPQNGICFVCKRDGRAVKFCTDDCHSEISFCFEKPRYKPPCE